MQPRLYIDTSAIEHNTRLAARLLEPHDIRLVGVTKACLGDPRVAGAMLSGGATALSDSRSDNLAKLRHSFASVELHLLRPDISSSTGQLADHYYVSSAEQAGMILEHLASSAKHPRPHLDHLASSTGGPRPHLGKHDIDQHGVGYHDIDQLEFLLMVETGDGREGVPLDMVGEQARRLAALPGARLAGAATNIACANPGAPPAAALAGLDEASSIISGIAAGGAGAPDGGKLRLSAGGSGLLRLLALPPDKPGGPVMNELNDALSRLDELRCGEALLLGSIPGGRLASDDYPAAATFLDEARVDAFQLEASVLEVYEKGGSTQVLLGIGSQDTGNVGMDALRPLREDIRPLSATSDYLTLALDSEQPGTPALQPGECLRFIPGYYALVAAMTSPFVEKVYT